MSINLRLEILNNSCYCNEIGHFWTLYTWLQYMVLNCYNYGKILKQSGSLIFEFLLMKPEFLLNYVHYKLQGISMPQDLHRHMPRTRTLELLFYHLLLLLYTFTTPWILSDSRL